MNTRHALGLTVSNTSLVIKVIIYTAVLLLIGIGIFVSVSNPILVALDSDVNLEKEIRDDFNAFLSGDKNSVNALESGLKLFFNENSREVTRAAILYVVLFVFMKFGISFLFVPISFVLYNKMSANFNTRYLNAIVAMAGKGFLYALTFTALTVPVDIAIFIAAYFLSVWLVGALGWIGLLITSAATIALYALRLSATGRFIPIMVCENVPFREALRRFFQSYNAAFIKQVFPTMLVIIVAASGIITTTAVATVGIVPLLVIPATFVAVNAANLVAYFYEIKHKFYIDERIISVL